ncbi:MAG: hypothetical protein ACREIA_18385 [Opitutaceae bacterium]
MNDYRFSTREMLREALKAAEESGIRREYAFDAKGHVRAHHQQWNRVRLFRAPPRVVRSSPSCSRRLTMRAKIISKLGVLVEAEAVRCFA